MSAVPTIPSEQLAAWPPQVPEIREALLRRAQSGSWANWEDGEQESVAQQLAAAFGQADAVLCGSGTFGVEAALRAANLQAEDEVIIAGYDYPGNLRAIEAVGAQPVIVDVESGNWVVDVTAAGKAITDRTRAILLSHLYGRCFAAAQLRAMADAQDLLLIEDACQAHGGFIDSEPVGSFGHIATLSFGRSKLMTAGCGGAVLASDPRLLQRLRLATERPSVLAPLSPLQAAALIPQLALLPDWTQRREAGYRQLQAALAASEIWNLPNAKTHETQRAFYKVAWQLPEGMNRDAVIAAATRAGVPLGPGFVGFLKRARKKCRIVGELPGCVTCFERTVLLDQRVLLSNEAMIEQVAQVLLTIQT